MKIYKVVQRRNIPKRKRFFNCINTRNTQPLSSLSKQSQGEHPEINKSGRNDSPLKSGRNDPPLKRVRNDPPQLGRIDSPWKSGRNDDFTAFSAVFQSYQDDRRVIMKRCAMEPRSRLQRYPPQTGLEPGTARSDNKCNTVTNYSFHFPIFNSP